MRAFRFRLLSVTAVATAFSVLANGVGAATAVSETRLGVSIQNDIDTQTKAVAQRNRTLDLREAAARATETRLKAELETQAVDDVQGKSRGASAEAGEQYDNLARVYQAMKPARAAVVFEQLEMDVQMQISKRMRDRAFGLIMGSMSPAGAAALSMSLARKAAVARSAPARPAAPSAEAAKTAQAASPQTSGL
jgi:flagellar motility protein MotE (MotC chaperone)